MTTCIIKIKFLFFCAVYIASCLISLAKSFLSRKEERWPGMVIYFIHYGDYIETKRVDLLEDLQEFQDFNLDRTIGKLN